VIIFMLRSWSAGPSATVEKSATTARTDADTSPNAQI
jgi:hypothetical protein